MGRKLIELLVSLRHSDEGAAIVEYVVLSALAVLVILSAVQFFFSAISGLFNRIAQQLLAAF
jgi:Flp pilus assembly pilin Flp